MKTLYEWTKRLGQRHYSFPGVDFPETLCGCPMLGNNYATIYKDEDKQTCSDCQEVIEMKGLHGCLPSS